MSNKLRFKVEHNENEMKLKEYLRMVAELSGRLIRGAAREGRINVNNKRANLNCVLYENDVIELDVEKQESQNIEPEKMEIDVIYEDSDIIVVNKKPGMVVHPTKSYPNKTLANGLLYYFREKGENSIVRLVSRLDMDTTGLIIVAKNQFAHMALARDMQKDGFEKSYLAIVHGKLEKDEATIDLPIYRTGEGSIKRIVDERGQRSITHYKVMERFKSGELVKLTLETGRTHQIRVHLTHLGNPLYGDSLYAEGYDDSMYISRQALHAYRLVFPHPRTKKVLELECNVPEDMKKLIDILKNS